MMNPDYYRSQSSETHSFSGNLIAIGAALALTVLGTRGCAEVTESGFDSKDAVRVVEANGLTNAEVTEVNKWFPQLQGCSKTDTIGFEVEATAPNGSTVDVIVCKGLFKAATVRFL